MLSMTNELNATDIKTIAQLKRGVVYALYGYTGDELVVKKETPTGNEIKQAGKVVATIDPKAKAKVLTLNERTELTQFCKYSLESEAFFGQIEGSRTNQFSSDAIEACDLIARHIQAGFSFIKMNRLEVFDLETAAKQRYENENKQPLRKFCTALVEKGGLEQLGTVIAGDCFNGNFDRFNFQYPPAEKKFGSVTLQLKALVNVGNVMYSLDKEGQASISMLDYIDPSSRFKDQSKTLAENSEHKGEIWPGRFMLTSTQRRECAEKVVFDLEAIMSPKRGKFSKSKLGKNAVQRVALGMWIGVDAVLYGLAAKAKSPTCPKGTQERYMIWKTQARP